MIHIKAMLIGLPIAGGVALFFAVLAESPKWSFGALIGLCALVAAYCIGRALLVRSE